MIECQKCGYIRKATDRHASEKECPSCGIIYAKFSKERADKIIELAERPKKNKENARARALLMTPIRLIGKLILYFAVFLAVFYTLIKLDIGTTNNTETKTVFNSGLDGSVYQVKDYLKAYLNDPGSLEVTHWGMVIKESNGYSVSVKYRAKNVFGGYVTKSQIFYLSEGGSVVQVVE